MKEDLLFYVLKSEYLFLLFNFFFELLFFYNSSANFPVGMYQVLVDGGVCFVSGILDNTPNVTDNIAQLHIGYYVVVFLHKNLILNIVYLKSPSFSFMFVILVTKLIKNSETTTVLSNN